MVPVDDDGLGSRRIPWNFSFLNGNLVLLFDSFDPEKILPRYLIKYTIHDNIMLFTESLTGYLNNTYLFIGDEKNGFIKFKLYLAFSYLD